MKRQTARRFRKIDKFLCKLGWHRWNRWHPSLDHDDKDRRECGSCHGFDYRPTEFSSTERAAFWVHMEQAFNGRWPRYY